MKYFRLFFLTTLFLTSTFVYAEYYRYVGKDGKVHYTDEYSKIPADQRPEDIKAYYETPITQPAVDDTETASDTDTEATSDGEGLAQPAPAAGIKQKNLKGREAELNDLNRRYNELKQVKTNLDSEYDALTKERAQLEERRKTLKTKEDIEKFNARIKNLTKKTDTYEQKTKKYMDAQAAYNIDIQTFNTKVEEDLKKRVSSFDTDQQEGSEQNNDASTSEPQNTITIDKTASIEVQRQTLMKHKAEIEKQYNDLAKQKKLLAEEKKNLKTKEEVDEYMQKKEALNQRISAFQKKQQVFDKEVLDFNTRQSQEKDKTEEEAE